MVAFTLASLFVCANLIVPQVAGYAIGGYVKRAALDLHGNAARLPRSDGAILGMPQARSPVDGKIIGARGEGTGTRREGAGDRSRSGRPADGDTQGFTAAAADSPGAVAGLPEPSMDQLGGSPSYKDFLAGRASEAGLEGTGTGGWTVRQWGDSVREYGEATGLSPDTVAQTVNSHLSTLSDTAHASVAVTGVHHAGVQVDESLGHLVRDDILTAESTPAAFAE
jgi:hypothetical protein